MVNKTQRSYLVGERLSNQSLGLESDCLECAVPSDQQRGKQKVRRRRGKEGGRGQRKEIKALKRHTENTQAKMCLSSFLKSRKHIFILLLALRNIPTMGCIKIERTIINITSDKF